MEDAEDAVEITVVLTEKTLEKLRELAGSDSSFSEYLSTIIQRQYTEKHAFGNTFDLEEIVSLAENLAEQNKNYQAKISVLREQYKRLAVSQEHLLATVQDLRETAADLLKNSEKKNIH